MMPDDVEMRNNHLGKNQTGDLQYKGHGRAEVEDSKSGSNESDESSDDQVESDSSVGMIHSEHHSN